MAAHLLDHKGRRAVGQVLGQDGAVDAREGLLAREAHRKHAEVALPGTSRDPCQAVCGDQPGAGPPSWGADSVLISWCLVGMVRMDRFPQALRVVRPPPLDIDSISKQPNSCPALQKQLGGGQRVFQSTTWV